MNFANQMAVVNNSKIKHGERRGFYPLISR